MAIYHAAFLPTTRAQQMRTVPSPGWCWQRASEPQREFCRRQADAAMAAMAMAMEAET